ncbi:MAG: hypothetical protein H7Y88_00495 [Phycisphaerales bacterium]|nr:hypothetical protein [Phycisphaerales bacterium]
MQLRSRSSPGAASNPIAALICHPVPPGTGSYTISEACTKRFGIGEQSGRDDIIPPGSTAMA